LCFTNFKGLNHLNVQFWMLSSQPKPSIVSKYSFSKKHKFSLGESNHFHFSCANVMLRPTFCMAKIHFTITWSSIINNTPTHPIFSILVLPFKWSENDVNGMFHSLLSFLKKVYLFSMVSMASSNCYYVQFKHTKIGANLLLVKCVYDWCMCDRIEWNVLFIYWNFILHDPITTLPRHLDIHHDSPPLGPNLQ